MGSTGIVHERILLLFSLAVLTLDVMDVSGEHQSDIDHDVFKVRLDVQGRPIKDSVKKGLPFFHFHFFFSFCVIFHHLFLPLSQSKSLARRRLSLNQSRPFQRVIVEAATGPLASNAVKPATRCVPHTGKWAGTSTTSLRLNRSVVFLVRGRKRDPNMMKKMMLTTTVPKGRRDRKAEEQ